MFRMFMSNLHTLELGLLIIRIGIGVVFAIFGGMKLLAGPEKWHWLGSQLSYIGIVFLPTVWGFLAANAEFFGGLCLIFGFATRCAALLIAIVMAAALMYHFNNNDVWGTYSFPLSLLIVLLGIFFAGPTRYSLDELLYQAKKNNHVSSV